MSFSENLDKIIKKHKELSEKLIYTSNSQEYVSISKELSAIEDIVEKINAFNSVHKEIEGLKQIIENEKDTEFRKIAEDEYYQLNPQLKELEKALKLAMLPKDEADEKNAIIEIRPGTGGVEASLFASEIFTMYQRYAEYKKWKFEILNLSETEAGGYKEASALIKGNGVFYKLKHESGVHRVQRIPETETGGRVHTSAVTVAVLPEAEDVDIEIDNKDLRIDTFRSSGAGGQHVNTTDSAVRVTHIPTGIAISQQDEKSQHKNKAKALKILRSRLYDIERNKRQNEISETRKGQIGSGDRSERIRTYNFPQSRVTDHRINLTLHKIEAILRQGELEELINALISNDEAEKLASSKH